ncbi:MAG: hypothetical protein ABJF23_26365 [Bryobacteraceae bacterium]
MKTASSPARIEANRRNANASTGPKTPEGKRRVSQNARKDGFRAHTTILTPAQQSEIETHTQFFAADFPHLHQQHPALFVQLGVTWWYLQQFNKLEDPCYVTTDYEAAIRRLTTLTRYRAHYERLFYQALCALQLLIENYTNKAKELPETIVRIYRRTNKNANRIQLSSSNPYRAVPKSGHQSPHAPPLPPPQPARNTQDAPRIPRGHADAHRRHELTMDATFFGQPAPTRTTVQPVTTGNTISVIAVK